MWGGSEVEDDNDSPDDDEDTPSCTVPGDSLSPPWRERGEEGGPGVAVVQPGESSTLPFRYQ